MLDVQFPNEFLITEDLFSVSVTGLGCGVNKDVSQTQAKPWTCQKPVDGWETLGWKLLICYSTVWTEKHQSAETLTTFFCLSAFCYLILSVRSPKGVQEMKRVPKRNCNQAKEAEENWISMINGSKAKVLKKQNRTKHNKSKGWTQELDQTLALPHGWLLAFWLTRCCSGAAFIRALIGSGFTCSPTAGDGRREGSILESEKTHNTHPRPRGRNKALPRTLSRAWTKHFLSFYLGINN